MTTRLFVTSILGLALCLAAGCKDKPAGINKMGSTIGARDFKVKFDGPGKISSDKDSAVVTLMAGKLIIEKERILLNDKEVAKVPAAATKFEVDFTKGTLTVTADGAEVLKTDLKK